MLEGAGHLRRGGAGVGRPRTGPPRGLSLRRGSTGHLTPVRRSLTALFAALAATVLVACPSSKKSSSSATPKRGGTLRIGIVSPASLDPAVARTRDELLVADQ